MDKEASKGRIGLFILFGIIFIVSNGNLIYESIMFDSGSSLSRLVSNNIIHVFLMYNIYTGKTWAKSSLSAFLIFGVLVGAIFVFLAGENLTIVIQLVSIILVNGYVVYFLNTNVEIQEFMKHQRNQLKIT